MPDQITISKTLSIRDCGHDENWLQEQIASNPSIIGLGDLVLVEREKRQLSGGKLDLLLKTRDGETVFEVEVMLGETNGDHIARTIEYWDLEERQDKKREHFPVLIAEDVTRRFFNVINRFSPSIPIIAIKANIVEVNGKKALHFTPILTPYQESVTQAISSRQQSSESDWQKQSPATLAVVQTLRAALPKDCPKVTIYYQKRSVSILHRGYYVFRIKPEGQEFLVEFWLSASNPAAAKVLEAARLPFTREQEKEEIRFGLKVGSAFIGANSGVFAKLAKLIVEDINL